MTKDTIEEAAKINYSNEVWTEEQSLIRRLAFIRGAKWQQERMYSEEDMIAFLDWSNSYNYEITAYRLSCTMKNEPFDSKLIFSMWLKHLKMNNYVEMVQVNQMG